MAAIAIGAVGRFVTRRVISRIVNRIPYRWDTLPYRLGIDEAGGRRVKRSIYIDVRSIGFCSEEMIERFRRMPLIAEYMEQKLAEIADASGSKDHTSLAQGRRVKAAAGAQSSDEADMTVGRHLTNLGTCRSFSCASISNRAGGISRKCRSCRLPQSRSAPVYSNQE